MAAAGAGEEEDGLEEGYEEIRESPAVNEVTKADAPVCRSVITIGFR